MTHNPIDYEHLPESPLLSRDVAMTLCDIRSKCARVLDLLCHWHDPSTYLRGNDTFGHREESLAQLRDARELLRRIILLAEREVEASLTSEGKS